MKNSFQLLLLTRIGEPKASKEVYPFAFNGQEQDDETYGNGNEYDFGARIYNARLGRWLTLDPLMSKYAGASPYMFSSDNPIAMFDPDGKDGIRNATNGNIAATMIFIYDPAVTNIAQATAAATAAQTNISNVWGAQTYNGNTVTTTLTVRIMTAAQYAAAIQGGLNTNDGQTNVISLSNTGRSATNADQRTASWSISDLMSSNNTAAHEFGHLLGLSDRYQYIQGFSATNGVENQYASVFLPQAQANGDKGYTPIDNLMSSMTSKVSTQQLDFIFSSSNGSSEGINTYTFLTAQRIPNVFGPPPNNNGGNRGNLGVFGYESNGMLTPPNMSSINRNNISGALSSSIIQNLSNSNMNTTLFNNAGGVGSQIIRNQTKGGRLSSGVNTINNLQNPYK